MNIPKIADNDKYYVAETEEKAHSSWDTLNEAMDSFLKFNYQGNTSSQVMGIIKVNKQGANLVFSPAILVA